MLTKQYIKKQYFLHIKLYISTREKLKERKNHTQRDKRES